MSNIITITADLQVEPDGVIRVPCRAFGDSNQSECADVTCRFNRAEQALNVIDNAETDTQDAVYRAMLTAQDRMHSIEADMEAAKTSVQTLRRLYNELQEKEKEKRRKIEEAKAADLIKVKGILAEQIEALSKERLVDLLAEQGIRQIGPRPDSPRIVLSEAAATIQASYWIKGNEFNFDGKFEHPWMVGDLKAIPVKRLGVDGYQGVTGVCSVGALAMARALLDDKEVNAWAYYRDTDRSAALAAYALADAIRDRKEWMTTLTDNATGIIINWNDADSTERDEVLEVWDAALLSDFLDVPDDQEEVYCVKDQFTRYTGLFFPTQEKAEQFLAALKGRDESVPGVEHLYGYVNGDNHLETFEVGTIALPAHRVAMV